MTKHDFEALSAMHDDAADALELKRLLTRLDDVEVLAEWIRLNRLSTATDASTESWSDVSLLEGVRAGISETAESGLVATRQGVKENTTFDSVPSATVDQTANSHERRVIVQRRWFGGASAAVAACFLVIMVLGQTDRPDAGRGVITTADSGGVGFSPGLLASAQRQTLERYYKRHREMSAQTLPSGSFELARLVSAEPFAQTYNLMQ